MAKKSGLGKGLDALFTNNNLQKGEKVEKDEEIGANEIVKNIKVIEIEPNKDQARKVFDEEALEELANSMKRYGVIQPIVVSKQKDYYEIIAGERRWRAAKKAGLSEIPAVVRVNDNRLNKEISLVENIQREDLNPIEKARGIRQLIDQYSLSQEQAAEILGMKRSSVANSVRILNLDERVISLALEGKLTESHCKALMGIQDAEQQYKAALHIVKTGEASRVLEKKVAMGKADKSPKAEQYQAIYRDIEDRFQGFFGTKVQLAPGKRSGKIVIQYNSNDDLERILSLINKG